MQLKVPLRSLRFFMGSAAVLSDVDVDVDEALPVDAWRSVEVGGIDECCWSFDCGCCCGCTSVAGNAPSIREPLRSLGRFILGDAALFVFSLVRSFLVLVALPIDS